MAVSTIQPVPSYALPFVGNDAELARLGLKFNPLWLKWFLDMIRQLQTGGGVLHNNLAGLQGGTAAQFYHLTLAQSQIITGTKTANFVYAGPTAGAAAVPAFRALVAADLPAATGTVTSVASNFAGGLISVAGSPITTSGTLAFTVAGTSGGVPYFSGATTWASSAALAQNGIVYGGGAGAAPNTSAALTSGKMPIATANGRLIDLTASAAYTPTNVVADRSYDANATTIDELADVLGTVIADLQVKGILG